MKIRDVAKAAGVSIATVSRVLNHPELVTEETRERIQTIISENNYAPNTGQRQTKHGKKKQLIAVIIPSLRLYRNLYSGIHKVCISKKYSVQLYVTENDLDDVKRIIKNVISCSVDGVIIASEIADVSVKEKLDENNIPYVCVGGKCGDIEGNLCYINYYDSACKLAEYLETLNLRQALLILSDHSSDCREELKRGFADTWKGELVIRFVEGGDIDSSQILAEQLEESVRPEVVVTQYDEFAFGIMKEAKERHVEVPEKLKVIGFDNSPLSAAMVPELTTVEQPTFRLGILAGRRLFDIIDDDEFFDVEAQEIALKGRLKIRRSCGNLKAIYEEAE